MMTSQDQRRAFNSFIRHPESPALMELAVEVITAAKLEWQTRGTRWGITVCADPTSVLRLNVGNSVLLDFATDDGVQLLVVHPGDRAADWGDAITVEEGLAEVKDSLRLVTSDPDHMLELLLDSKSLFKEVRAYADATSRELPRGDWHNPLVDELLIQVADAVFEDYDGAGYDPADFEYEDE